MEEDIEKLIKELTKVRPEMLNEEALKLFNTIIAIIDERDYLLKAYKQDEMMIKLIAEEIKEQWNVELNVEYFRKKLENE